MTAGQNAFRNALRDAVMTLATGEEPPRERLAAALIDLRVFARTRSPELEPKLSAFVETLRKGQRRSEMADATDERLRAIVADMAADQVRAHVEDLVRLYGGDPRGL